VLEGVLLSFLKIHSTKEIKKPCVFKRSGCKHAVVLNEGHG